VRVPRGKILPVVHDPLAPVTASVRLASRGQIWRPPRHTGIIQRPTGRGGLDVGERPERVRTTEPVPPVTKASMLVSLTCSQRLVLNETTAVGGRLPGRSPAGVGRLGLCHIHGRPGYRSLSSCVGARSPSALGRRAPISACAVGGIGRRVPRKGVGVQVPPSDTTTGTRVRTFDTLRGTGGAMTAARRETRLALLRRSGGAHIAGYGREVSGFNVGVMCAVPTTQGISMTTTRQRSPAPRTAAPLPHDVVSGRWRPCSSGRGARRWPGRDR
jgi:hypothetical protein